MAFIKDKKSKSGWVISIQDLGLNTTFSTKEISKPKAKETLTKIQFRIDQLKKNKDDEFFTYNSKEKRRFVTTGYRPEKKTGQKYLLEDAIADYLGFHRESGSAISTIEQYQIEVQKALDFYGNEDLKFFSASNLQDYVFHLQKQRNARGKNRGELMDVTTQKKYVAGLRRLCSWAVGKQKTELNLQIFSSVSYKNKPTNVLSKLTSWVDFEKRQTELEKFGIEPSTENAFSEIIFTKQQLTELVNFMKEKLWNSGNFENRRFFTTLFLVAVTGIRRSEVSRIQRSDIYIDDREITIWLRKGSKGLELRSHTRVLPENFVPYLQWLLENTPEEKKFLFVSSDDHFDGKNFDQKEEKKMWDELTRKIKSAYKNTKWENAAGYHKFRHTLASIMLSMGISRTEVKETIGWCSDEMADRYQHLLVERKREVIEKVFAN